MNKREKVYRCANTQKKKSTVADTANGPTYSDEDWLKAKELITANIPLLASNNVTEERSNLLSSIKDTIDIANNSIKTAATVSASLRDFVGSLMELMKIENVDIKIRFTVANLLYALFQKKLFELTSQNFVNLICFLIENCPTHKDEKNMISLIRKLRKLLSSIHSDEKLKSDCVSQKHLIMSSLKALLQQLSFCVTDNGREIVSHIVALDEIFINYFHASVKKILLSCSKSDAIALGKICFRIWELSSEDTRKILEENCIQWVMDRAFTLGRHENIVKYLSVNVQSFLTGLHSCRKLAKFSKVITTLYSPLIWKYLNCDNPVHRANAADIFMNVYPLEKPGEGKSVYSRFLRKQHEEMLNLLDDPCPAIRVIAIRGICSNMKYFWITFQNGTIEQVIKKLITEMVMDGSSSDVRKAVYQGITQLLENSDSHKLLKGVLPSLARFLHDENPGVRHAFLNMLLKIKNTPCEIKYFHIVDIDNIAARLENDSPSNQKLIVKLIYSSFFGPKIKLDDTIKRLCKFIDVNPVASRYLATHSKEELSLKEATDLMCLILIRIYMDVKKNMELSNTENKDSEENEKSESIRKSGTVLGSIENLSVAGETVANMTNSSDSTSSSEETCKRTAIHNPNIAHGLFDFVNILWLYYGKRLQEDENKEYLDKLYTCSIKCIPLAVRFFRGTHAFFGVLNMAGVIPLIKIQHQTTIIGTCMSMLRQVSDESKAGEMHCIIHVLCQWNRGGDVLELAREWLDEGLRSQKLNESYYKKEFVRSKRVKFSDTQAKPALALRVLEELFNSPYDQQMIFSKHTNDLVDLLNYLSRIKILIKKRIAKGSELNDLLNDNFLKRCLTLYGNLIIMFRENKVEDFNFWKKMAEYFEWCDQTFGEGSELVVENIEEEKCIGEFLRIPMIHCYNLIALGKCDDKQLTLLSTFYLTTLNSRCGMYCIEAAVIFIKQLLSFSRVHHCNNRNNDVMTVWFPRLIDTILDLLTDKIYTKEILSRYIKNVVSLRKDLIFIYILVTKLYPKLNHSSLSYQVLHSFCNHLINIVLFPIRECETLNVDQSIKNLPPVGSLLAGVLISQVELASAFLFVLNKIIGDFTDSDALHLLAVASLLYTLASTQGKIKKSEILKVVQVTHNKLQSISTEEGCLALVMNHEQTIGDRTVIDIEETTELAVKEIGKHILKMIAEHLGGSLS